MMKSFLSTGSLTTSRMAWMYSRRPWKYLSSVSTLRASAPPAADASNTFAALGLLAAVGIALALAKATGIFRPSSTAPAPRFPNDRPAWPLLIVWILGVSIWLMSQMAYVGWRQARLSRETGR